jgi:hypothetical protein
MSSRSIPATLALALGLAAARAGAQEATPVATGEEVVTTTRTPYWALIGAYEQDTHDSRYGMLGPQYVRPFGNDKAWFAYLFGTYLSYEFDNEFGGRTEVTSPGVSPGVGLMWFKGGTQWAINAGVGYKDRDEVILDGTGLELTELEDDGGELDVQLGGQVYADLTSRQNLHGIVSFGTADQYIWSRLGYKVRVTDDGKPLGIALGVEGVGQGNEDIRSFQGGGLVEFQFSEAAVMVRAGYKHSSFDTGSDQDGPYWGVNLYKRF